MKIYIATSKEYNFGIATLLLMPLDNYIILGEFDLPEGVEMPSSADVVKAYREYKESQKEVRIAELKHEIAELEGAA